MLEASFGYSLGFMYRNSSQVWTENGVTYDLQSPSILSDHPKCKLGHWNIWEQLR